MPLNEIERIAIMVNKAMSTQARSFHTAEHIFNLVEENHPIQNLAVLFHDIAYFTIDQGFIPEIESILGDYVIVEGDSISIRPDIEPNKSCAGIAMSIFGFQPGDFLQPFGGMNEFLSALVFVHEFHIYLDQLGLLETICYIEATIPFRPLNDKDQSSADCLNERLESYKKSKNIKLDEKRMVEIIQQAISFANKDVENFAEIEVGAFLDNTWKLLPETNPSLRITGLYTVKNYRLALQKMTAFMNMLDPCNIYSSFQGIPSDEDLKDLNVRAKRNVLAARDYLGIKLLTTGILEAVADISGGDVPIALLMGNINDKSAVAKFESMLPISDAQHNEAMANTVYVLLAEGRGSNSKFDLSRSPLARYIYLHVGTKNISDYLMPLQDMIDGKMDAADFLEHLPGELIKPILAACAEMAFTRRESILEFVRTHL